MYKSLIQFYTNSFQDICLYFVYLLSIGLGIYIIISKNPVISVLFLIGLFCSISLYLIIIGLYFIGLSYILVYVGAISILFLFILMLINIRVSELLTNNNNSAILAFLSVLCFSYTVDNVSSNRIFEKSDNHNDAESSNDKVNLTNNIDKDSTMNIADKSWIGLIISNTHIASIGNILYTNLSIFFVIISIILLLAMVGAIIITIYRPIRDDNKSTSTSSHEFIGLSLQSKIYTWNNLKLFSIIIFITLTYKIPFKHFVADLLYYDWLIIGLVIVPITTFIIHIIRNNYKFDSNNFYSIKQDKKNNSDKMFNS